MHRLYNKIDALKAAQENIMSHSHSEQKVLLWRHIMNIYELFSGLQWQGRKVCGFQKLHCQRRPDFPRAKLVILSHADWFECIWMTVLTSPGIGSCLCDQPASELHFKEGPIFIALTLEDSHWYAALTVSFQCCNQIKKTKTKTGCLSTDMLQFLWKCNTWWSCWKTHLTEAVCSKFVQNIL